MGDTRSLKIFTACALGGGIGAFVAFQMHPYLWWMGMIVGGFVGYLSYEYEAVLAAIPRAWRKTTSWRPDWKHWRPVLLGGVYVGTLFLSWIALGFFVLQLLYSIPLGEVIKGTMSVILLSFIPSVLIGIFFNPINLSESATDESIAELSKKTLMEGNPISFFWKIIKSFFLVVACIPLSVYIGYLFLRHLIVLIHTEDRLLCFMYAALGAGIGHHFAGNNVLTGMLIGTLAGGLLGITSKRIAKLVLIK